MRFTEFAAASAADVPLWSVGLSIMGLVLARWIAPRPLRPLTRQQQWALTALLIIILFVIVTGGLTGEPMEPGPAIMWGVGLGFSGLTAAPSIGPAFVTLMGRIAVEFFAERVIAMLKAAFGVTGANPNDRSDGSPPAVD